PCVSRTSASEIYTLSLHDALPMSLLSIFPAVMVVGNLLPMIGIDAKTILAYLSTAIPESVYDFIQPLIYDFLRRGSGGVLTTGRSEEHTSELQSRLDLVCRLPLDK